MYKYLGLFVVGVSMIFGEAVQALDISPTSILPVSPLIITSVEMSSGAKDIDFIEVFNNGKSPISFDDWRVVANDTSDSHMLDIEHKPAYIEPKTHVVFSRIGFVTGSSYQVLGWKNGVSPSQNITNLSLENDNYRPQNVTITNSFQNTWLMRKYNTDSYSDAASAFASPWRGLFDDGLYAVPKSTSGLKIVEIYPYSADCNPLENDVLCRDYVKLVNNGSVLVNLDDYVLRTDSSSQSRTSSNTIPLSGDLYPGEFLTISTTENSSALSLTNSGGYVWLEDIWGMTQFVDSTVHYEPASALMQGQSYAMGGDGVWQWTTTPSPNTENRITQTTNGVQCSAGSIINPVTNRCNKVALTSSLTPCKEGQERNAETNRCRSVLGASDTRKPCLDTQYRSEETGRCRNLPASSVPDAAFAVKPVQEGVSQFVGWWVLGGVGLLAAGYGVYEWRFELGGLLRRVFRRK